MPLMRLRWLTIMLVGGGLLSACAQTEPTPTLVPTPTPTATPASSPTAQAKPAPGAASLTATRHALPMVEGETVEIGGAGLPAGEPVRISVTDSSGTRWDVTSSVTPMPLVANAGGAFVATLEVGRWATTGIEEPGALTLSVSPLNDYNTILATTLFVFCPPGLAGRQVSLTCEVVATGAGDGPAIPVGTTYVMPEWRLVDGRFELHMGDTAALGYQAGERINNDSADIVMTIKFGDSIMFNAPGLVSISRNTQTHFFTIDELGIDEEVLIGARGPTFIIAPDKPGTFRIYCSAHPDDHGTATLIVEA